MKKHLILKIPKKIHAELWRHLLPTRFISEEAAFMFVSQERKNGTEVFKCLDWCPVPSDGYHFQSGYHFELSDKMKAKVIKQAFDLNASLVEFHSHIDKWPAQFSASDFMGLHDFVPHIWWRLKGRPYLAVVVSRSGFDGFVWIKDPETPERLDFISVDNSILRPTRFSPLRYDLYEKNYTRSLRS